MPDAYFNTVPPHLRDRVCPCDGGREGFTSRDIPFPWWVHAECLKPAPLNAINARLIRECEFCEEEYFIEVWPDRNDLCPACK